MKPSRISCFGLQALVAAVFAPTAEVGAHAQTASERVNLAAFGAPLPAPDCGIEWTGLYVHFWDESRGQKTTALWARGNGWVVLSLVEMIRNATPGTEMDRRLRAALGQLLAELIKRQDSGSGLWHTVLDAPDTPLETSASAMFLYGLVHGWRWQLDGAPPEAVLRKTWRGLARQVNPKGRVVGVSAGTIPGDKARYAARPLGTYPWGNGAFMLAAAAMAEIRWDNSPGATQ